MTGSEKALCHCRMLHNNPLWAVDNYMHTIYVQAHVPCNPEIVHRNNLLLTCFMELIFLDTLFPPLLIIYALQTAGFLQIAAREYP
jgi:hypothetical protein